MCCYYLIYIIFMTHLNYFILGLVGMFALVFVVIFIINHYFFDKPCSRSLQRISDSIVGFVSKCFSVISSTYSSFSFTSFVSSFLSFLGIAYSFFSKLFNMVWKVLLSVKTSVVDFIKRILGL
uniref:Uncharacterized protein n=2 Tax=Girardia TaxID=52316 RepID=A0A0C4ZJZ0_9PLAT|nr:hypothetical protein [Girardia sp. ER-2015]QWT28942.1 hypothetical protein [Girardia tigrina]